MHAIDVMNWQLELLVGVGRYREVAVIIFLAIVMKSCACAWVHGLS